MTLLHRRTPAVALAAAVALLAATPAAAQARSSYCSPSGDSCKSVAKVRGKRLLQLSTAALYGPTPAYELCVRPPRGGETCRTFRLRSGRFGQYSSRVTWSAHFPNRGRGRYRVRWDHAGITYGPSLTFTR